MMVSSDAVTGVDVRGEVAAMLGVEAQSLAPDSDLVMHGLDSLRMMRLAGQWRKRGHDVDFARLAADPRLDAWVRASRDRLSRLKPNRYITAKVPMMEMGRATAGIRVADRLRRMLANSITSDGPTATGRP